MKKEDNKKRFSNNFFHSYLILKIAIILLLLVGIGILVYKQSNKNKYDTYVTLSYEDMITKIDNGERFVLFIGSDECSHCSTFKITVDKIVKKYDIEINYINIGALNTEEYAYLNSHFPFSGTPTTVIVEDGKKGSELYGAKGFDATVKFLTKQGIIKE